MTKEKNLSDIIEFLEHAGKLRSAVRFNATLKNSSKETTSEHSWRLALMTFLVANELKIKINVDHAIKLALIHDLAESVTGDIDAYYVITGHVKKEEKDRAEIKAIKKITKGYIFGKGIEKLCKEYLEKKSKEAKFVKALDKIEALLYLNEVGYKSYKRKQFYANYADEAIKNFPELKGLLNKVKSNLKKELMKGNIEWVE